MGKNPNIDALVLVAADIAKAFGGELSAAALRSTVESILQEGQLWGCFLDGLITLEETRNRFLANVESSIRAEFAIGWDVKKIGWRSRAIEAAVDSALTKS